MQDDTNAERLRGEREEGCVLRGGGLVLNVALLRIDQCYSVWKTVWKQGRPLTRGNWGPGGLSPDQRKVPTALHPDGQEIKSWWLAEWWFGWALWLITDLWLQREECCNLFRSQTSCCYPNTYSEAWGRTSVIFGCDLSYKEVRRQKRSGGSVTRKPYRHVQSRFIFNSASVAPFNNSKQSRGAV